ncbi:hypothetical protein V8G61_05915 [Gaetbulibacter sp. M240]|uniref:hypothetical protein n=1 Tax=Gaetbulibacter sp. M240 TaxID=3126511 RepID=UPI00374FC410
MKKYIKSFLIGAVVLAFLSCNTDAPEPEVSFTVDNANPQVGETITFTITGGADTYVIYTGDTSHDFANSYLVITAGMDVDQESMVLVADSLPEIRDYLEPRINSYNAGVGAGQQYNLDNVMSNISNLVGKEYSNRLTAAYEIWEYVPGIQGEEIRNLVDLYFEDNSVLLAPDGGFSTGVAINRYETTYTYTYNETGTFTATLIASNVGEKQYSGSGYINDRTSSGNEYDINRAYKELVINVQP